MKEKWIIRRTSCMCGGNWAWLRARIVPDGKGGYGYGGDEMMGCVCHNSGPITKGPLRAVELEVDAEGDWYLYFYKGAGYVSRTIEVIKGYLYVDIAQDGSVFGVEGLFNLPTPNSSKVGITSDRTEA